MRPGRASGVVRQLSRTPWGFPRLLQIDAVITRTAQRCPFGAFISRVAMKPLLTLLTAGLLLGAGAPARGQDVRPNGPGTADPLDDLGRRELRKRWAAAMDEFDVPGMAVAVVKD